MFKITGLEEVNRKLEELERKANDIHGENIIQLSELLPAQFMIKYTDFKSLEEMFQASGFVVESSEDFKKIPEEDLNNFIKNNTQFSNWDDMIGKASMEWIARKLGF